MFQLRFPTLNAKTKGSSSGDVGPSLFASPCVKTSPYKTPSKVIRPKPCSQVTATLVAEIGHKSDHRRHEIFTFVVSKIHRKQYVASTAQNDSFKYVTFMYVADTPFLCIYIGFTNVSSTSRNVERINHPHYLTILILPQGIHIFVTKPSSESTTFNTICEAEQHCIFGRHA